MKRIIFLALSFMLIACGTWAADTSVIGSIWKQEGNTALPADDITYVDFTGYTSVGLADSSVFDSRFVNVTGDTVTGSLRVTGNIVGGSNTSAIGTNAAVLGGSSNGASSNYSVVGGGQSNNCTSGVGAAILGGTVNQVSNNYAAILGGSGNTASGEYSAVLGGRFNTSGGDYSVVGGRYAVLSSAADRTTAFTYGTTTINITKPDVFIIYGSSGFEKKVGIQTTTPHSSLTVNGSVAVAFNHYSSGNSPVSLDENHMSVNCDASSGNVTFNLVSSVNIIGRGYEITITDDGSGTNKCYIDPAGSETLNGFTTYSGLDTTGESVLIRATSGSTWDWTIKGGF